MELDNNAYKQIYNYLNNEMTNEELLTFENKLLNDIELKDTVTILKKMEVIYSPDDWLLFNKDSNKLKEAVTLFRNNDINIFSEKVRKSEIEFKKKHNQSKSLKRILIYASSIAAIGLIFFSGYLFKEQKSTQDLYSSYYTTNDLPSFSLKNDEINQLANAENLFKAKKYDQAISLFESIEENSQNQNPSLKLYLALTNSELKRYDQALEYLEELEHSNTLDQHKSYWFRALIYLKQGNRDKAILALKLIAQNKNYFNYQKAINLLEELD
ncbi:tetratricopeptide repeat protein [Olleya sp. R77988]|uniref:tetratricopeptide repeat protein n=1 Tax=Olleya sp. R77988 TaxID=3093875 RepID=UPI0037CC221A